MIDGPGGCGAPARVASMPSRITPTPRMKLLSRLSIPPIAADLKAGAQDIQWIIDSYILVFAGLLLTSGSLGA
ncbi:hypothetical protein [Kitasatospora sp. NPDC056531]|uniref:hypothetical protein n=1 Tax=Kitasatospora sp. NPDC056531 TaxID=3345856 RepID=UPI0036A705AF